MAGFRIQLEKPAIWAKAVDKLHRLTRLQLTPIHEEIGEYLVAEASDRFRASADPQRRKWAPLKRQRARRGQQKRKGKAASAKILVKTGLLRKSVNYRATEDGVEVGSNLVYAARHNFGYEKNGVVWTPQREFLGIGPDDPTEIEAIITEHVGEVLEL